MAVKWSPVRSEFDYTLVNGAAQVQYLGQADEWIDFTDPRWTVKKFYYTTAGDGTTQVARVEVLGAVAWSDRATLPWP